jgi:hypothetical protein
MVMFSTLYLHNVTTRAQAVLAPCIFLTLPLVVPVLRSLINTVFFTKRHFPSQFVHKNVLAGTACVERNITGLTL